MTATAPSGRRRATSAGTGLPEPTEPSDPGEEPIARPSERLAALLAELPAPESPEPPGPPERPPGSGPAHRWEVATRTRVPRSFLLLVLAGLAVLAWVLFDPGSPPEPGQEPESGAEDVLAEMAVPTATGASAAAESVPALPPAAQSAGPPLLVHVTGEVAEPGVVEVDPGARVLDAVEAAGGLTDAAVTGTVNLAAPVTDGQQVLVPDEETAHAAPPAPGAPADGGTGAGGAPALLNLNSATAADLEVLPRVGPVLAQRIVEFRDAQGGFADVAHLDAVPGIGPVLMETLAPLVTV